MMDKDLVSIITATYNSSDQIEETYQSIVSQSHTNWEWLVTDDCSADDTLSVLDLLAEKDHRIRVFKNEVNSGAAVSRNKSISEANGEYLAFLDSDDIWHDEKLQQQLAFMKCLDCAFSFTAYELIDQDGNNLGKTVDSVQSGYFNYHDMLLKKATLGCSTVILKTKHFENFSMPLLRTGQDYATWLNLLKKHPAYVLPKVLTKYRIMPNSISRNKFKKALRQWEIYRSVEKLSLFYSIYCFVFYAYRAVVRR